MLKSPWLFSDDMAFILLHAKLQLPSNIIVDVTAVGMINRVGLLLQPYETWCSAPAHHVGHCEPAVSSEQLIPAWQGHNIGNT